MRNAISVTGLLIAGLLLSQGPPAAAAADTAAGVRATEPLRLDWKTLLPESERATSKRPVPPAAHDYLSEGDMVALQTGSYEPNRELEGRQVKVPGYAVPLERDAGGRLSEFLLVPYFGACIHLPPPPPNQVIYVRMRAGTGLKSIDDAVWVTGRLRVAIRKSSLGAAVYTLEGERVEPYHQ